MFRSPGIRWITSSLQERGKPITSRPGMSQLPQRTRLSGPECRTYHRQACLGLDMIEFRGQALYIHGFPLLMPFDESDAGRSYSGPEC